MRRGRDFEFEFYDVVIVYPCLDIIIPVASVGLHESKTYRADFCTVLSNIHIV